MKERGRVRLENLEPNPGLAGAWLGCPRATSKPIQGKLSCFFFFFCLSPAFRECLVLRLYLRFVQIWICFFFLLKLNAVCTFWIVLMCWCQKWFLKNKKTSLACISARKAIWKAPATTLPNTLLIFLF